MTDIFRVVTLRLQPLVLTVIVAEKGILRGAEWLEKEIREARILVRETEEDNYIIL